MVLPPRTSPSLKVNLINNVFALCERQFRLKQRQRQRNSPAGKLILKSCLQSERKPTTHLVPGAFTHVLFPTELSASMEKSSSGRSGRTSRSRMSPRKERGALANVGGHRQSKPGRTTEATSVRKEKTEKAKVAVEPDAEVKLKTTVVDIDSVREEMKEESFGLLEAAEQDGKRQHCPSLPCSPLAFHSHGGGFGSLQG